MFETTRNKSRKPNSKSRTLYTKWYKYNQVFLDDGQAFKISGQLAEVAKQQTQGEYNIEFLLNAYSMLIFKNSFEKKLMELQTNFGKDQVADIGIFK